MLGLSYVPFTCDCIIDFAGYPEKTDLDQLDISVLRHLMQLGIKWATLVYIYLTQYWSYVQG